MSRIQSGGSGDSLTRRASPSWVSDLSNGLSSIDRAIQNNILAPLTNGVNNSRARVNSNTLSNSVDSPKTHDVPTKTDFDREVTTFVISEGTKQLPDLTLLVNPSEISISDENSVMSTFVRGGSSTPRNHSIQHWGANQTRITVRGTTRAFMVGDIGLETRLRRQSESYKNLIALLEMYEKNGYNYVNDVRGSRRIWTLGLVRLTYGVGDSAFDVWGHFDDFTYSEVADSPFLFNFNFSFTVLGRDKNKVQGHLFGHKETSFRKDAMFSLNFNSDQLGFNNLG